ncbi:hypothetical protein Q8A67_010449 [Cirrhinus molitorella]|uniref:Uncharacterized protein n=1 Tax=Cirrhinus molitorella TaxID=172907 RepID=A0AA88Q428_9TELE|nr:hypothetical protein Q8A67_010449 [Cirrhinus molitorella]
MGQTSWSVNEFLIGRDKKKVQEECLRRVKLRGNQFPETVTDESVDHVETCHVLSLESVIKHESNVSSALM